MMGIENPIDKKQIEMLSLDQLVPADHLVRRLGKAIDLGFIYLPAENLYSPFGTKSIDLAVLIKLNIIQYTFGITITGWWPEKQRDKVFIITTFIKILEYYISN